MVCEKHMHMHCLRIYIASSVAGVDKGITKLLCALYAQHVGETELVIDPKRAHH